MFHCGMRQMEERHVANQVDLMVWSQRLDLLALSNFKGEIQVHRLHWQKVWNLPPPNENNVVKAMAWRPDGKALAIGYNSGCVCIVNIEDKEILDKFYLNNEVIEEYDDKKNCSVTYMTWLIRAGSLPSIVEYNLYDDFSIFLPKPPSLNTGYKSQNNEENVRDFKEVQDQSQLNMLIVGYSRGNIHMSVFGRFHLCTINLPDLLNDQYGDYKILDITLSDDFSVMQVLYLDKASKNVFTVVMNTTVLSAYSEEVFVVAARHSQITQLLSHLDQTMISITEAWEHIILEMDAKMAEYAASVPEGGVSADFLELLMMGVPSDELELFLLRELTAKGLKKFGSSVELSYSTIQKLVLKQLNIVGQSLTYHLSELRGLSRIPDRYKILGLDEGIVTEAIKSSCAFLNKCLELQQVIDISMRNYKAFFRWLYGVIVRLLDEQAPTEIVKITQQDLSHIAEFLYNFDNVHVDNSDSVADKPVKFNLERLAQYLQDQELSILPEEEDNSWQKFLKDNPCLLKDNDTIFSMSEFRKFSLVQQQNHLKNALNKVFNIAGKDIVNHFSVLYNLKCYDDRTHARSTNNFRLSQLYDANQHKFMMALLHTPSGKDGLCFMSINFKPKGCSFNAVKYYFTDFLNEDSNIPCYENIEILDVQFYSTEYISVLLQHPHKEDNTVFLQLPLKIALDNAAEHNIKSKFCIFNDNVSKVNLSNLLDSGVYKVLDKMDGFHLAVSGGRKVAVVLSKSLRKVRVFEMEVDAEDEEETIDSTPQSQNTTHQSDNHNTPDKGDNITLNDIVF